mmetsp:Transcript_3927/g.11834  ORF Transcript_3927/g.11834 Transcript_3927/m.11834 type:complete len:357 (-) Transcript_3927:416-1486(-)
MCDPEAQEWIFGIVRQVREVSVLVHVLEGAAAAPRSQSLHHCLALLVLVLALLHQGGLVLVARPDELLVRLDHVRQLLNGRPVALFGRLLQLRFQSVDVRLELLDELVLVDSRRRRCRKLDALDGPREFERAVALIEMGEGRAQRADHGRPRIARQGVRQQQRELRVSELREIPLEGFDRGRFRRHGLPPLPLGRRARRGHPPRRGRLPRGRRAGRREGALPGRPPRALLTQVLDAIGEPHQASIDESQLDQAIPRHLSQSLVLPTREVCEVHLGKGDLIVHLPLERQLEHRVAARALRVHGGRVDRLHSVAIFDEANALLVGCAQLLRGTLDVYAYQRVYTNVQFVGLPVLVIAT